MRITGPVIQGYLDQVAKVAELRRRASSLAKQAAEIEAELEKFVADNGGKARSVKRSGFILSIVQVGRQAVPWRKEFERIAGVDGAELLVAAALPRFELSVQAA